MNLDTNIDIIKIQNSSDQNYKILFKTYDGYYFESVYMGGGTNRLCISTQIGCSLNCKHCATGKMKYERNLTSRELLSQILILKSYFAIDSCIEILIFGMGEPCCNLKSVYRMILNLLYLGDIISDIKNIFLATSGINGSIKLLAKQKRVPRLVFSLHSAIQNKRESLLPHSRFYTLNQIYNDLIYFQQHHLERIIIHTTLIKGFNDNKIDAVKIEEFMQYLNAELHIIPFNPVIDINFESPKEVDIKRFLSYFSNNTRVSLKRSKAADIRAACGQLKYNNC